jgi:hypothetical protein
MKGYIERVDTVYAILRRWLCREVWDIIQPVETLNQLSVYHASIGALTSYDACDGAERSCDI